MKTKTQNTVDQVMQSGNRRIRRAKRQLAKVATPVLIALVGGLILGSTTTLSVQWIDHNISFQSPITKKILSPIPTNPVVIVTPTPTHAIKKGRSMSDREIRDYIYSKGWDKSIALRLAKSENYYNLTGSFDCERTNTNTDGSIDTGIFQINSVHRQRLNSLGMSYEDMKDCRKNIDFAYDWIYKYSGWQPWSAYINGSYLTHNDEI